MRDVDREWGKSRKIAYFYLTMQGKELAARLCRDFPGKMFGKEDFKKNMTEAFSCCDALVCIMAAGIVVRTLAPCLVHKARDPAVVVMDQQGRYAISLLSGHLGGANELAACLAASCGGEAVVTTATDVERKLAFDIFAKENNLAIENIGSLKYISSQIVEGGSVDVITDRDYGIFDGQIRKAEKPGECPLVVIDEGLVVQSAHPVLYLRPRTISVGVGCKRGMAGAAIRRALECVLHEEGISPLSIKSIATIGLKAEEAGIRELAGAYQVPLLIVEDEKIKALDFESLNIARSGFVEQTTGLPSVSTACAYLTSKERRIIRDKAKFPGVTIALAR